MEINQIDTLEKWFAEKTHTTTLRSGLPVTVKRATIESLVIEGAIPVPLIAEYRKYVGTDIDDASNAENLGEALTKLATFYEAIVHGVLLFPKIGKERDLKNGVIIIDDLSFAEKEEIANLAQKGTQLLIPFRQESTITG